MSKSTKRRSPRPVTTEERREVCERYAAGESTVRLGKCLGRSAITIYNILRDAGVNIRSKSESLRMVPRALTVEQKAGLLLEAQGGVRPTDLARKYGVKLQTVSYHLRQAGLTVQPRATQEQRDAMVAAVQAGASVLEAANAAGFSHGTCRNALKEAGAYNPKLGVSQEIRRQMAEAYLAGSTLEEAGTKFGYTAQTCLRALVALGIPTRGVSEARRIYGLDDSYFSVIDTPEKATWLGFLSADGYINETRNTVKLTLQRRDRGHLVKFADALKAEGPIRDEVSWLRGKPHESSTFRASSPQMVADLARLGVRQNKSHTICPWNGPIDLLPHYWQGVWDGDGMIRKSADRGWELFLCGNRFMVEGFATFVANGIGCRWRTKQSKTGVWYSKYGGVELPQEVMRLLHANSVVWLDRKRLLVEELLAVVPKIRGRFRGRGQRQPN